jgi:uncharacterized protein (DUF1499 family)
MKLLIGLFIIGFIILLVPRFLPYNQSHKENKNLGLIDGHLSPCPDKPNCIISTQLFVEEASNKTENKSTLAQHFNKENQAQLLPLSKTILLKMGATLIAEEKNYLAVTFSSKIFKFVDDFELHQDNHTQQLYIRSASRLGYSDFGVNQQRVEYFIEQLKKQLAH